MLLLLAATAVSAAILWGARLVSVELGATRDAAIRSSTLEIVKVFAPAIDAAAGDPRAILVWEPLARTARQLFPEEFARIDRTSGTAFPFGADRIQSAHAQWTSDWLAWERTHDSEYKLKAAAVEEELSRTGGSPLLRARLDAVESEKLDRYQRRYAEYVRVAKALQALTT